MCHERYILMMLKDTMQREERCDVTVRERILAIRLSERIERQPDYARSIDVAVDFDTIQQKSLQIMQPQIIKENTEL